MRKCAQLALAMTVTMAATASAQTEANPRVMKAATMGNYKKPLCELKGGDFRTSSAGTYLSGAHSATNNRDKMRQQAVHVSKEAVEANAKSAAGWYYLGRAELELGNLTGADTAFTHAQQLSPDCAGEIEGFRQTAWFALFTPASEFIRQQKYDSAMALLREAMLISKTPPQTYYNLAVVFTNQQQNDSALYYFKLAQDKAAANPKFAKERASSTFNLAALYQQANRHQEAIAELTKYLQWMPNDVEAKKALAMSYRMTNQPQEAARIEKELMAQGGDSGKTALDAGDLMSVGVNAFQAKQYDQAIEAFTRLLATEPGSRDALFNLANTYLAKDDGPNLLATARKLVAVDPMNESSIKLLGEGFRKTNAQDSLITTVERLFKLPVSVDVTSFQPGKAGAKLLGTAIGREPKDISDKPLPATPVGLTFEFLNAKGEVVASQEVNIPALRPGQKQEFTLEGQGEGILVWRYRVR